MFDFIVISEIIIGEQEQKFFSGANIFYFDYTYFFTFYPINIHDPELIYFTFLITKLEILHELQP